MSTGLVTSAGHNKLLRVSPGLLVVIVVHRRRSASGAGELLRLQAGQVIHLPATIKEWGQLSAVASSGLMFAYDTAS